MWASKVNQTDPKWLIFKKISLIEQTIENSFYLTDITIVLTWYLIQCEACPSILMDLLHIVLGIKLKQFKLLLFIKNIIVSINCCCINCMNQIHFVLQQAATWFIACRNWLILPTVSKDERRWTCFLPFIRVIYQCNQVTIRKSRSREDNIFVV